MARYKVIDVYCKNGKINPYHELVKDKNIDFDINNLHIGHYTVLGPLWTSSVTKYEVLDNGSVYIETKHSVYILCPL